MARTVSENFDAQSDLILASAVEVFAIEGFELSSMNRIAERAGVSKSLIYHYFPSKETLLFEAMRGYLNRLVGEMSRISETPREHALRAKLHRLLQEYRVGRRHHVVLMNEVRSLSQTQREQILMLQKTVVDSMRGAIARCVPNLGGEDLKAVTMLVFGMVNWIHTWYSDSGAVSHSKLTELVDTMVCGAMQGLAESSEIGGAA